MSGSVTLFVMAKNEARCLRRCIDSVAAYVDHVLVLDTGSTDDTVSIAQSCGAEVRHFPWEDDFGMARNVGLTAVRTRWALILDADEWLISGGHSIREVATDPGQKEAVFELGMQMCSYEKSSEAKSTTVVGTFFTPRMFLSSVRYAGRVHERLIHNYPIVRLPVLLGHDGYEAEQARRKKGRNFPLLEKSLAEFPKDPIMHYYMAKELQASATLEGSFDVDLVTAIRDRYRHAVALTTDKCQTRELITREFLMFLRSQESFEEGIRLIFSELEKNAMSREFSFLAAVFLYESAFKQTRIEKRLLLDAADALFIRLKKTSDNPSNYFPYDINLNLLASLRQHATKQSVVG